MLEISLRICCCTFCTRRGFAHSTRSGVIAVRGALVCEMACVFLCPARKGAARAGHMEETRRAAPRCGDVPAPARGVCEEESIRPPQAEGRTAVIMLTTDVIGDVSSRADGSFALSLKTDPIRVCTPIEKEGESRHPVYVTRGSDHRLLRRTLKIMNFRANLVNPRPTYFRETPDADSRSRHFEARARGGGGAPFPRRPSRSGAASPPGVSTDRLASRTKSPRLRHFRRTNVWSQNWKVSDSTRRECGEVLDDEHKVRARRNRGCDSTKLDASSRHGW